MREGAADIFLGSPNLLGRRYFYSDLLPFSFLFFFSVPRHPGLHVHLSLTRLSDWETTFNDGLVRCYLSMCLPLSP